MKAQDVISDVGRLNTGNTQLQRDSKHSGRVTVTSGLRLFRELIDVWKLCWPPAECCDGGACSDHLTLIVKPVTRML